MTFNSFRREQMFLFVSKCASIKGPVAARLDGPDNWIVLDSDDNRWRMSDDTFQHSFTKLSREFELVWDLSGNVVGFAVGIRN